MAINDAYVGRRDDILALIPCKSLRVLDVGCSIGTLGQAIKAKFNAEVVGIELSEEMAALASTCLDQVLVGSVEEVLGGNKLHGLLFDTIIFGDLLEHLADPWSVLNNTRGLLAEGGTVIASIPNVRHWSTLYNLAFLGIWPARNRGIHDKTHLRFFTRSSIIELFRDTGFDVVKIVPNLRIMECPCRLNRYARFLNLPFVRDFLAFQYIALATLPRDGRQ